LIVRPSLGTSRHLTLASPASAVIIIEALFFQKYLDGKLRLSIIPICLGVILTSATDYRLNLVGTLYAVAGVIVTSFYQIWSGTLQKSLECDALQLQFYAAPLSAIFILPFIPLFDNLRFNDPASVWNFAYTPTNIGLIFSTGMIAFLVNISIFLVIGKSSALTYNILGHAKTCFVLINVSPGRAFICFRLLAFMCVPCSF